MAAVELVNAQALKLAVMNCTLSPDPASGNPRFVFPC